MDAHGGSGRREAHPADPTPTEGLESCLVRGWVMAEATLAAAPDEWTLVTHWFEVPGDEAVNADRHFGSDARTLRFLAVAVPTLIEQLGARAALLALPWDLDGHASLSVVAIAATGPAALDTRRLHRLAAGAHPPFWRLGDPVAAPAALAAVATQLTIPGARPRGDPLR